MSTAPSRPLVAVVVDVVSSWPYTQRCLDSFSSFLDRDRDILVALIRDGQLGGAAQETIKRLKLYPWVRVVDGGLGPDADAPIVVGSLPLTNDAVGGTVSSNDRFHATSGTPNYASLLNGVLDASQELLYDILLLMDSLTLMDAVAFSNIIDALQDSRVGAVGPMSNNATGDQLVTEVTYDPNNLTSLRNFSRSWAANYGGQSKEAQWLDPEVVALRRQALVGGFNSTIYESVYVKEDMLRRIAGSGWKLKIAKGSFVHCDSSNTWMSSSRREQIDHDRQIFQDIHGEQPRSSLPMLISACLITKDEERNLPECLESLANIADEIVIYDTGSSDSTVEIARRYGATVVDGYWDDDFSRARNAAREMCRGQWILWVDADERVVNSSPASLRQSLSDMPSSIEGCLIHIDNLEGTGVTSAFTHPACRVFRRLRCHWHGRLHEQISLIDKSAERAPFLVPFSKLRLLHVGYLDEAIRSRAKPERNVRVAAGEIKEATDVPEDSRDESYLQISLARSKSMVGEAEEAVDIALEAVKIATDPTTMRLGMRTAIEAFRVLGRLDEALEQIDELRRCSSNPVTANVLEATIRLQKGEPEVALSLLENIGEREVDDDMFEYHASQFSGMKARALYDLGRYSEASDLLLKTLSEEGVLDAHLGDLIDALERSGRSVDEVASVLRKGRSLVSFMAQLAQLPPEKADGVLEACYVRWGENGDHGVPSEVMATAAIVAKHLSIGRELEWSLRIRDMGIISQDDPLMERARNIELPLLERALAAASPIYAFGDHDAYVALRAVLKEASLPDASNRDITGDSRSAEVVGDAGDASNLLRDIVTSVEALSPGAVSKALMEMSIVVYCHNDATATVNCLLAIQSNCRPGSYEVILVDDASTDSTSKLSMPTGSGIRVHRNSHYLGRLESYRLACQLADSPNIALMDQHFTLEAGQMESIIERLEEFRSADSDHRGEILMLGDGDNYKTSHALLSGEAIGVLSRDMLPTVNWKALEQSISSDIPNERALASDSPPYGTKQRSVPAVHVIGPLGVTSGLGKAARLTAEVFMAAGYSTLCTSIDVLKRSDQVSLPTSLHHVEEGGIEKPHVDIICMNPDQMKYCATRGISVGCENAYMITRWDWEMEEPPKEAKELLGEIDELWVLSDFERRSFSKVAPSTPIYLFPYPLHNKGEPLFGRESMGIPQGFIFLNVFDAFSNVSRKNPDGLIEAFTRAFKPGEGPILLMKINNADKSSCLARLRQLARGRDDIKFIVNEVYTDERMDSLIAAADCYISLHRSEGFGLPLADAMSRGKTVIATGYSGNLDFMNDANSYLVPWQYTELLRDDRPYPTGARWAEPDLNVAAEIMRYVFEHQDEARAKGETARTYIEQHYSLTAAVEFAEGMVSSIFSRGISEKMLRRNAGNVVLSESGTLDRNTRQAGSDTLDDQSLHARSVEFSVTTRMDDLLSVQDDKTVNNEFQVGMEHSRGVDVVPPAANYRTDNIVFSYISEAIGTMSIPARTLSKGDLAGGDVSMHDVVIIFSDPDAMPAFAVERGEKFFERYVIGCFDWPLEEMPANVTRGFRYMNEIWVPSEQAYRAVSRAVEASGIAKPVIKLPLSGVAATCMDVSMVNGEGCSAVMDLLHVAGVDQNIAYILNVADVRTPLEMNNTIGVIEAFLKAFPDSSGANWRYLLVIAQSNGVFRPSDRRSIEGTIGGREDIAIVGQVDMADIAPLVKNSVMYVSLRRATGFDWPLMLAASAGVPVVVTGRHVREEWSDASGVFQVPAVQGTVPAGCWPYPEGASWLEPDLDAASELLAGISKKETTLSDSHDNGTNLPQSSEHSREHTSPGGVHVAADLRELVASRVRFAHNAVDRARRLATLRTNT